jgi:hypothetical protein
LVPNFGVRNPSRQQRTRHLIEQNILVNQKTKIQQKKLRTSLSALPASMKKENPPMPPQSIEQEAKNHLDFVKQITQHKRARKDFQ